MKDGAGLSRWERSLVREIRILHPEQLVAEMSARRYRRRVCLVAFLDRVDALAAKEPEAAERLAERTRRLVDDVAPKSPELRLRALSSLASALSRRGRMGEARERFAAALALDAGTVPELGALWSSYALHLGRAREAAEASRWAEKAVRFFRGNGDPRIGSCDRWSLAAALVARGRVAQTAGERASDEAGLYLAALEASTEWTPASREAASRLLAEVAPLAWISEDAGFHPRRAIHAVRRLDRRLKRAGESKRSKGRRRLQWVEGLALAHLGKGLTGQSRSYLAEARTSLGASGARDELLWFLLDVGYLLLWEGDWAKLAPLAAETVELGRRSGRSSSAALRRWASTLGGRRLVRSAWEAVYREVRGVRAPLVLPEAEGAMEAEGEWRVGW